MKEIAIFGSYCNTKEKLAALEKSITQAKAFGLDVLVFGRYPIPESTQQMCDYWIFDKSNPVMTDRALNHWKAIEDKYISNWFYDYGYAALEQIVKTLGFAKSLNYDIAYWLVYDVDLTHFEPFREICLDKLQTHNAVCHQFHPTTHGPAKGIDGTSVGLKIQTAYDKLKGTITETFYRDLISRRQQFISEDFMEECFRVSEMNHYILPEKPKLPATLTSTGARKHGDVPPTFPKTKQYFDHCNVGWDENNDNVNVFIWGIKHYIESIVFDFGVDTKCISDISSNRLEFNLDYKPTKCEILEINEQPINEILDPEFTELYWKLFKIKNL